MLTATTAGCSGKRQRTEFVPLSEFDERDLISDYNFLEEAAQLADSAQRSRQRLSSAQGPDIAAVRQLQHQVGRSVRSKVHRWGKRLILLGPMGISECLRHLCS